MGNEPNWLLRYVDGHILVRKYTHSFNAHICKYSNSTYSCTHASAACRFSCHVSAYKWCCLDLSVPPISSMLLLQCFPVHYNCMYYINKCTYFNVKLNFCSNNNLYSKRRWTYHWESTVSIIIPVYRKPYFHIHSCMYGRMAYDKQV